jgi:hypothetical protein
MGVSRKIGEKVGGVPDLGKGVCYVRYVFDCAQACGSAE